MKATISLLLIFLLVTRVYAQIFEDDFEGDESEWSGTFERANTDNDILLDPNCSSPVFLNSESLNASLVNATSSGEYWYYYTVDNDELYMRTYVQLDDWNNPFNTEAFHFMEFQRDDYGGGYSMASVGFYYTSSGGTNYGFRLRYLHGSYGGYSVNNITGLTFDAWYYVELYMKVADGTSGEYRVWVNGTLTFNVTGKDTDNLGNITRAGVGVTDWTYGFGDDFNQWFLDAVVIDTSYIGPYTPPTKTWNQIALWNCTLNTMEWNSISLWNLTLNTKQWVSISLWNLTLIALGWHSIALWNVTLTPAVSNIGPLFIGLCVVVGAIICVFILDDWRKRR